MYRDGYNMTAPSFGSVCSGIEAVSQAWHPLGFRPAWFAEIEAFPAAVLAHHYPGVPNYGDMTLLAELIRSGQIEAPDVLAGGTPCQAFSVAGARGGMLDPRGALTLAYVDILNAIDEQRPGREAIALWENVPGVLSDVGNAFGHFLAAIVGDGEPIEPDNKPPPGKSGPFWRWAAKQGVHVPKWPDAGCISGPRRSASWRVLNAEYFGVAQRRRRVFVVASARHGADTAAVLFEFDGMRRDSPPLRSPGQECAGGTTQGPTIYCAATGQGGAEVAVGVSPALTCNHEAPIIAGSVKANAPISAGVCPTLMCSDDIPYAITFEARQDFSTSEHCVSPLTATMPPGAGVAVFAQNTRNELRYVGGDGQVTGALSASQGTKQTSYLLCSVPPGAAVVSFEERYYTRDNATGGAPKPFVSALTSQAKGGDSVPLVYTVGATWGTAPPLGPTVDCNAKNGPMQNQIAALVLQATRPRRLTPNEYERLQGFPAGHTAIRFQNKPAPDTRRYKAVGNSMAVPVIAWIGKRMLTHMSF